ncbi:unnamed protein product, partial [marine sediment metagenome]
SNYELVIRYRGTVIPPGGHCDSILTPWGTASSFQGRWIPRGRGLGGRYEMPALTKEQMSRGKDLTPHGAVVEPATRPDEADRVAGCLLALDHKARRMQLDAARYLGRLGPAGKAGVGHLSRMLEQLGPDSHDIVGMCVLIEALGLIGPDARSALPLIQKLSGHRNPNVRSATVGGVARICDFAAEAGPFLERMAQDTDERVVRAAASALRQVKPPALPVAQPATQPGSAKPAAT